MSLDEVVVVGRKQVAAWVLIDGWVERPDVYAFLDTSAKCAFLRVNNFKIALAKVMALFASMLHYGGFALTRAAESGGEMFIDA